MSSMSGKHTPGMRLEGTMGTQDHAIFICGPETGHAHRVIAYCDEAWRAKELVRAALAHEAMREALKKIVFDWDGEPEDMAEAVAALKLAEES